MMTDDWWLMTDGGKKDGKKDEDEDEDEMYKAIYIHTIYVEWALSNSDHFFDFLVCFFSFFTGEVIPFLAHFAFPFLDICDFMY